MYVLSFNTAFFETFFNAINVQLLTFETFTEMHVGFHVKSSRCIYLSIRQEFFPNSSSEKWGHHLITVKKVNTFWNRANVFVSATAKGITKTTQLLQKLSTLFYTTDFITDRLNGSQITEVIIC